MSRPFIAFVSTLVLSTLIAPAANATTARSLANLPPHLADQVNQTAPDEPFPFQVQEYLQNERVGR